MEAYTVSLRRLQPPLPPVLEFALFVLQLGFDSRLQALTNATARAFALSQPRRVRARLNVEESEDEDEEKSTVDPDAIPATVEPEAASSCSLV